MRYLHQAAQDFAIADLFREMVKQDDEAEGGTADRRRIGGKAHFAENVQAVEAEPEREEARDAKGGRREPILRTEGGDTGLGTEIEEQKGGRLDQQARCESRRPSICG